MDSARGAARSTGDAALADDAVEPADADKEPHTRGIAALQHRHRGLGSVWGYGSSATAGAAE